MEEHIATIFRAEDGGGSTILQDVGSYLHTTHCHTLEDQLHTTQQEELPTTIGRTTTRGSIDEGTLKLNLQTKCSNFNSKFRGT
jgi:hypothetical protein